MPDRIPPSPSDTATSGRSLAAIAANPVTGTTLPLGVAFFWLHSIVSAGNDQIAEVKNSQNVVQVEMAKVSASVGANSETIKARSAEVQGLAATVVELKSEVAMLKRDIEAEEKASASMEARLSAMENKR